MFMNTYAGVRPPAHCGSKIFSPFRALLETNGKVGKVPFDASIGEPYERGTILERLVSFDKAVAAIKKYAPRLTLAIVYLQNATF